MTRLRSCVSIAPLALWMGAVIPTAGCGNTSGRGVDAASSRPDSVVCASSTIGAPNGKVVRHREAYNLVAMNRLLQRYPGFAAEAGMQSVSDCDGARAFGTKYGEYEATHPGFAADMPIEVPQGRPLNEVDWIEAPQVEIPKMLGGIPGTKPQLVQITQTEGDSANSTCSGTFIAKNWILTAAHCLTGLPRKGAVALPDGGYKDDDLQYDNVATRVDLEWADSNGQVVRPDGSPYFKLNLRAVQYRDSRYFGYRPFDVALIWIYHEYDPWLPPNPDEFAAHLFVGGITEIMASDYFWGFGHDDTLREATISGYLPLTLGDGWWKSTIPSGTPGPTICHGDSGGPILPSVQVSASKTAPAVAAVLSGWNPSPDLAYPDGGMIPCPTAAGLTPYWAPLDREIDSDPTRMTNFVAKMMQLRNGPLFNCRFRKQAGESLETFASCWGSPCKSDSDCDTDRGEYCSRSGNSEAIQDVIHGRSLTSCPICANPVFPSGGSSSLTCDCVYGQCLQRVYE